MTDRERIIQTINSLVKCESMIFTEGLNLMLNNELKEVNEVFEVGDEFKFDINHLEGSADINVQLLLQTIKEVRNAIDSLQNLNLIKDEEIEWN